VDEVVEAMDGAFMFGGFEDFETGVYELIKILAGFKVRPESVQAKRYSSIMLSTRSRNSTGISIGMRTANHADRTFLRHTHWNM